MGEYGGGEHRAGRLVRRCVGRVVKAHTQGPNKAAGVFEVRRHRETLADPPRGESCIQGFPASGEKRTVWICPIGKFIGIERNSLDAVLVMHHEFAYASSDSGTSFNPAGRTVGKIIKEDMCISVQKVFPEHVHPCVQVPVLPRKLAKGGIDTPRKKVAKIKHTRHT